MAASAEVLPRRASVGNAARTLGPAIAHTIAVGNGYVHTRERERSQWPWRTRDDPRPAPARPSSLPLRWAAPLRVRRPDRLALRRRRRAPPRRPRLSRHAPRTPLGLLQQRRLRPGGRSSEYPDT